MYLKLLDGGVTDSSEISPKSVSTCYEEEQIILGESFSYNDGQYRGLTLHWHSN